MSGGGQVVKQEDNMSNYDAAEEAVARLESIMNESRGRYQSGEYSFGL